MSTHNYLGACRRNLKTSNGLYNSQISAQDIKWFYYRGWTRLRWSQPQGLGEGVAKAAPGVHESKGFVLVVQVESRSLTLLGVAILLFGGKPCAVECVHPLCGAWTCWKQRWGERGVCLTIHLSAAQELSLDQDQIFLVSKHEKVNLAEWSKAGCSHLH